MNEKYTDKSGSLLDKIEASIVPVLNLRLRDGLTSHLLSQLIYQTWERPAKLRPASAINRPMRGQESPNRTNRRLKIFRSREADRLARARVG